MASLANSSADEDSECRICLDSSGPFLYFSPCRHKACHVCVQKIRAANVYKASTTVGCPFCRQAIEGYTDKMPLKQPSFNQDKNHGHYLTNSPFNLVVGRGAAKGLAKEVKPYGRAGIVSIGGQNEYWPPTNITGSEGSSFNNTLRVNEVDYVSALKPNENFLAMAMDKSKTRVLTFNLRPGNPKREKLGKQVLDALIPHAAKLAVHPYGNFVLQSLIEVANSNRQMNCHGECAYTALVRSVCKNKGLVACAKEKTGMYSIQRMIASLYGATELKIVMESIKGDILDLAWDQQGLFVFTRIIELNIMSLNPPVGFKPRIPPAAAQLALSQFCAELAPDAEMATATAVHKTALALVECIRWSLPLAPAYHAAMLLASSANCFVKHPTGCRTVQGLLSLDVESIAVKIVETIQGRFADLVCDATHSMGVFTVRACIATPSLPPDFRVSIVEEIISGCMRRPGLPNPLHSEAALAALSFAISVLPLKAMGSALLQLPSLMSPQVLTDFTQSVKAMRQVYLIPKDKKPVASPASSSSASPALSSSSSTSAVTSTISLNHSSSSSSSSRSSPPSRPLSSASSHSASVNVTEEKDIDAMANETIGNLVSSHVSPFQSQLQKATPKPQPATSSSNGAAPSQRSLEHKLSSLGLDDASSVYGNLRKATKDGEEVGAASLAPASSSLDSGNGQSGSIIEIAGKSQGEAILDKLGSEKDGGSGSKDTVGSGVVENGGHVHLCVVCKKIEPEVVLLPCSHFCVCAVCTPSLPSCPVCSNPIASTMQITAPSSKSPPQQPPSSAPANTAQPAPPFQPSSVQSANHPTTHPVPLFSQQPIATGLGNGNAHPPASTSQSMMHSAAGSSPAPGIIPPPQTAASSAPVQHPSFFALPNASLMQNQMAAQNLSALGQGVPTFYGHHFSNNSSAGGTNHQQASSMPQQPPCFQVGQSPPGFGAPIMPSYSNVGSSMMNSQQLSSANVLNVPQGQQFAYNDFHFRMPVQPQIMTPGMSGASFQGPPYSTTNVVHNPPHGEQAHPSASRAPVGSSSRPTPKPYRPPGLYRPPGVF